MHYLRFEIKQAHLSSLRFQRPFTERIALTPGRLDMLRSIHAECGNGPVLQSDLRHTLGVVKSAISVMIRALEREGFLTRVRNPADKRTFVVFLTLKTNQALRQIHHDVVLEPWLDHLHASSFGTQHAPTSKVPRITHQVAHRLDDACGPFRRADGNPWYETPSDDAFLYARVIGNPCIVDTGPRVSEDYEEGHEERCDHDGPLEKEEAVDESAIAYVLRRLAERKRLRTRIRRKRNRLRRAQTTAPPPSG